MKNVYYENFLKYSNYVNNKTFNSYTELVEGVSKLNISKEENLKDRKAMVMFGFSGNGKTTWINSFCKSNPDYVILSMDSIVKEISNKLGRQVKDEEIIIGFSEQLDELCCNGKNIVVDGNFLNLLTRMALVDSLHTYGYEVSLVNITPIFDITIKKRIMSEASRVMGVPINEYNISMYQDKPTFVAMEKRVREYHNYERISASYDEQVLLDAVSFGVENVIVVDKNYKSDNIDKKKI